VTEGFYRAIFSRNSVKYWDELCAVVPDLRPNFGVPQSKEWHPEGAVHIHICKVIDAAAEPLIRSSAPLDRCDYTFVLAALFHDIGKAATHEFKNGIHSFRDHETKSVEILQDYHGLIYGLGVKRWRLEAIVRDHMRAHRYIDGRMTKRSKRLEFIQLPHYEDLLKFAKYDRQGKL